MIDIFEEIYSSLALPTHFVLDLVLIVPVHISVFLRYYICFYPQFIILLCVIWNIFILYWRNTKEYIFTRYKRATETWMHIYPSPSVRNCVFIKLYKGCYIVMLHLLNIVLKFIHVDICSFDSCVLLNNYCITFSYYRTFNLFSVLDLHDNKGS